MTLIRADARSPIQVSRGGEVLRLNTVTILFGALMASSFPSKVKHEAISLTGPVPGASNTQEPVSLPEFVSLINFSEFLLAAKANATESPSAREAAEILSAKFAGPSTGTNSEFLHAVVQNEPGQRGTAPETLTAILRPLIQRSWRIRFESATSIGAVMPGQSATVTRPVMSNRVCPTSLR